ncbi:cellulase family glycosylhydrolase [Roseiflexus sp.]|uniref:cellulase family glycosylhydrolase n=1 Tax=Roseiflexus sp. TaxID=2562120 RepID=UPI00398AB4AF
MVRFILYLTVIGLLSGALAAFTWFDNEVNRGVTYTPPSAPVAWSDVPQIGVNAYNLQFEPNPADVTRTLELARAMGAHFVRIQMPWDDVEIHAKGDFVDRRNLDQTRSSWEKYDFIVAEAQRLGLELIVRIDRAPQWARPNDDADPRFQAGLREHASSTGPPENNADYADFVAAVAARYRGRVRFIQIWNEPNLAYEWSWRLPEPERFVELLRAAATAARATNPDVVILFPSLSPTDGKEPRIAPMSELEYLDRVYRAGGAPYFDIMSAQAYGLGQPPDENRYIRLRWRPNAPFRDLDRPIDTRIDVSRVVLLREVMERHGDGGKAIWISEFGYNSAPDHIPEPARNTWGPPVSEEVKGVYLVGQMERARREWPWIGVMNIWFLRWGGYREPDPADPTPYFALVDRHFQPLPAYEAVRAYAMNGAIAGAGAHTWRHPAVELAGEGVWRVRFTGQSLALQLNAPAWVSIDGGMAALVEPPADGRSVIVASGLADTVHVGEVRSGVAPEWFVVGRERPFPWVWTLTPTLIVLALASAGIVMMLEIGRSAARR